MSEPYLPRRSGSAPSDNAQANEPAPGLEPSAAPSAELFAQFEVIRKVLDARKAGDEPGNRNRPPAAHEEPQAAPSPSAPGLEPEPAVQSVPSERVAAQSAQPLGRGGGDVVQPDTASERSRRGRRGLLLAGAAALSVFVGGAGLATVFQSQDHRSAKPAVGGSPAAAAAAAAPTPQSVGAADWVAAAVGPGQMVACDVSVCSLLKSRGFPASSLVNVLSATDVEQADVVVVTPVLRREFGSVLDGLVSSEPLAVYGTGGARVEADAVALEGSSSYAASLAADRASRRTLGTALLGNPRITFGGAGRAQARASLADGLVDTRLCALLATLAAAHQVEIAGFTVAGPGAGPDVPNAGVLISGIDGAPVGTTSATASVLAAARGQQSPYLPMSAVVSGSGATSVVSIVYSQPEPLGLLGSGTP